MCSPAGYRIAAMPGRLTLTGCKLQTWVIWNVVQKTPQDLNLRESAFSQACKSTEVCDMIPDPFVDVSRSELVVLDHSLSPFLSP
eukprot:s382_g27.t1